jgi:hypothetical protein
MFHVKHEAAHVSGEAPPIRGEAPTPMLCGRVQTSGPNREEGLRMVELTPVKHRRMGI